MGLAVHCGGMCCGEYIRIYLSAGYTYIRYIFNAKSFPPRIHARMDISARGALLPTYAVYIPAAPR
jgi:hypothetical protein